MKFSELESIMLQRDITSLANIARALNTTPQAVSNWKSRDQVPYHIIAKLNKNIDAQKSVKHENLSYTAPYSTMASLEENTISIYDILLTISSQLKVIVLTTFIMLFLSFTYVQLIQQRTYVSWTTVLLPDKKMTADLSGIARLVTQFGVSIPMETGADLSSPSLYPELLQSRTFAEKILDKEFYTKKFGKKLPLLSILTHGDKPAQAGRDKLIVKALKLLNTEILEFNQERNSSFSVIQVTTIEPALAKELLEVVLAELEALNRSFKRQNVNEKIIFIENRIASVEDDLEYSERSLRNFKEQNRQISSPALELEQERFTRDVEVQKGIYLTLKQELELTKIEEVQETSIIQILDKPQEPLSTSNKDLKRTVLTAIILGIGLGILFGFIRAYINKADFDERKKLRHIKNFIKKKFKDLFLDQRITGFVSILLIIGLPFYLAYKSPQNPVYFGMYSPKVMFLNTVYVIALLLSSGLFIYSTRKK